MKLIEMLTGDPFNSTIYGERYLNDTKGRFENYSEVDPRYDPQSLLSHINLPYTLLSKNKCIVYKSSPSKELVDWVRVADSYKFFWHPDVVRRHLKIKGVVQVQPTGSTRTLLTELPYRVYIKTDLDKKHFRFIRRLQRSSIEHSIAICSDLRNLHNDDVQIDRYAFLPESLGLVICGGEHEGSGVLYREVVPYPHINERRTLLPYHALYASDPRAAEDEPLLVQLIKLHGAIRPLEYFLSEIIRPILETWIFLVSRRGLLPELHGQNTLIDIDANLIPRRIVHRDFQGTYSDSDIRLAHGLPLFTKHVVGTEEGTTVQSQYSHVFDGMIGRYLLSRLSSTFAAHFGVPYEYIANAIRWLYRSLPGWDIPDFPPTVYRFKSSAEQQVGNEVSFVDTGLLPEFR